MKKTKYVSIGLKLLIVAFSLAGLIFNFANAELDGYSSAASRLLYFTNQSNIWVASLAGFFIVAEIIEIKCGKSISREWICILKLAFTVSITLTGVFFCFILAPGAQEADYRAWTIGSVLVHAVVPTLAIADFFIATPPVLYKRKHNLISLIPPLYYFVFCVVLYLLKVDFGRGDPFPYFFLNFGSPAGIFGFSDEFPYKIGTFYWVIFISGAVYLTSLLYAFLNNLKLKYKKRFQQH